MPFGLKSPKKMNFWEKRKHHSLTFPTTKLHAIRKIYRAVFRENRGERETERERDGPKFKGPPDAIAKPSDQKIRKWFLLSDLLYKT